MLTCIWKIISTCKSDLCHVVGHTSPTKWNHT